MHQGGGLVKIDHSLTRTHQQHCLSSTTNRLALVQYFICLFVKQARSVGSANSSNSDSNPATTGTTKNSSSSSSGSGGAEEAKALSQRACIVKHLLALEPRLLNLQDQDGTTAVHLAALSGYPGCLKYLLDAKADVTIRDSVRGLTALEVTTITHTSG